MFETNTIPTDTDNRERVLKSTFWTAFAILVILLIFSTALLSIRLYDFVTLDKRSLSIKTNTSEEFDLFSINYRNDVGEITVDGVDGDKVIAPGTEVEYTIRIRNSDKVTLNYTVEPLAEFHSEHEIPVQTRIINPDDTYLAGSAKSWVTLGEINNTEGEGSLKAGETAEYIFQWRWPFENGDDKYDTFLGDNVFEEEIGVTVSFSVYAQADTTADANGGIFGGIYGSTIRILLFTLLLIVAIILLIVFYVKKYKKTTPPDDGEENGDELS